MFQFKQGQWSGLAGDGVSRVIDPASQVGKASPEPGEGFWVGRDQDGDGTHLLDISE